MEVSRVSELEGIALEVRKDVVRMVGVARARGLDTALAVVDLLVYLYWEHMSVYPRERARADRDRLVLSDRASTAALYACLARLGFFDREELWSYGRLGAMLQGRPDIRTPGIDAPGGGDGGGIGIASGLCAALRLNGVPSRVFCLMGENEMSSGAAWESVSGAASDNIGNLVSIVNLSSGDESLRRRLETCGWTVAEADGHDFSSIERALCGMNYGETAPKALIAHTRGEGWLSLPPSRSGSASQPLSGDDIDNMLERLEGRSCGVTA
jgi:transketolase